MLRKAKRKALSLQFRRVFAAMASLLLLASMNPAIAAADPALHHHAHNGGQHRQHVQVSNAVQNSLAKSDDSRHKDHGHQNTGADAARHVSAGKLSVGPLSPVHIKPIRNPHLPKIASTVGLPGRGYDLNLNSQDENIVLGTKLFRDSSSLTIDVGGETKTFHAGDKVTAAEFVALKQVAAGGSQTVKLDSHGAASGGSFLINQVASQKVSGLVIPKDVTAYDDFGLDKRLGIGGDLTNYGTIDGESSSNHNRTGIITANDITNAEGGLITTNLDVNRQNKAPIDLTLDARGHIANSGKIESTGTLNLNADSGNFYNVGTVASTNGDINFNSEQPVDININGHGGTFTALNGNINVRDALYSGTNNINMGGGDYFSHSLNLNSGVGTIEGTVGKVSGNLNSNAEVEHFNADTKVLTLGTNCITGDPTFANIGGDIVIAGANNFAQNVAILAAGNVVTNATGSITARTAGGIGQDIIIVAGATINLSAGAGGDNAGSVNLSAGTTPGGALSAGQTATVNFNAGAGGDIFIGTSGTPLDAHATAANGAGGNIILAARAVGSTGGGIVVDQGIIDTRGSGTGNGGNVTIIGGKDYGSPSAVPTMFLNTINTSGGNGVSGTSGNAGNVTIVTSNPTGTGGALVTFNNAGQITNNGPITYSLLAPTASIAFFGDIIALGGGGAGATNASAARAGGNGGNIMINCGSDLSLLNVYAYGGGGGGGASAVNTTGAPGGKGGNIDFSNFPDGQLTLTVTGVLNSSGGGGGGGGTNGVGGVGGAGGDIDVQAGSLMTLHDIYAGDGGKGGNGGINFGGGGGGSFGGGGGGGASAFGAGGGGGTMGGGGGGPATGGGGGAFTGGTSGGGGATAGSAFLGGNGPISAPGGSFGNGGGGGGGVVSASGLNVPGFNGAAAPVGANGTIFGHDPFQSASLVTDGTWFGGFIQTNVAVNFVNSGTITGTTAFNLNGFNLVNLATGSIFGKTVNIGTLQPTDLFVTNNGLIAATDTTNGHVFIGADPGKNTIVGNGGGPVGTIQVPATTIANPGNGINFTLDNAAASDSNQLIFAGSQLLKGITFLNANATQFESVSVLSGASVVCDSLVTVNSPLLVLQGNLVGKPLFFNNPGGGGTIANLNGDVNLPSDLKTNARSLAIIASGNINGTGCTFIDLSNGAGSAAAELNLVAGYNFTPASSSPTVFNSLTTYNIGAPSAGGSINLQGVFIDGLGNGVGSTGTNVAAIANNGSVNIGTILTSGLGAGSQSGQVFVIGEKGVSIDTLFTASINGTSGTIQISCAKPQVTSPGSFLNGNRTGILYGTTGSMQGDITIGLLDSGTAAMTFNCNALSLTANLGSLGTVGTPITTNANSITASTNNVTAGQGIVINDSNAGAVTINGLSSKSVATFIGVGTNLTINGAISGTGVGINNTGDININAPITATATNALISTVVNNGNINISANVTAQNLLAIGASGAGSITQTGGILSAIGTANSSIFLASNTGNIGTSSTAILTTTPNLGANTTGDAYLKNLGPAVTGNVTNITGSKGATFELTTTGTMNVVTSNAVTPAIVATNLTLTSLASGNINFSQGSGSTTTAISATNVNLQSAGQIIDTIDTNTNTTVSCLNLTVNAVDAVLGTGADNSLRTSALNLTAASGADMFINSYTSLPLNVNSATVFSAFSLVIRGFEGLNVAGPVAGGDITLTADNGNLSINGNITCLDVLSLNANGSGFFVGNITQNPTVFVSTPSLLLDNQNGNIGTSGANIRTDATKLAFSSLLGDVFVTDTSQVTVNFSQGNNVRVAGSGINVAQEIDGSTVTLVSNNDTDITLNFMVAASAVTLIANGLGNIIDNVQGNPTLDIGNSLVLVANGGNIGSAANPIVTNSPLVKVTNNGGDSFVGSNGDINLASSTSANFQLTALGKITTTGNSSFTGTATFFTGGGQATDFSNSFNLSGTSIVVRDTAATSLTVINSGNMTATTGSIDIVGFGGQNVNIGGGGTMNALAGGINLTATELANVTNTLNFTGNQTFNGIANLNATGEDQSITVQNGVLATGHNTVNLNTCALNLIGTGNIVGNPLIMNCTDGTGTIANSQGDINLTSDLIFNGLSLAIIASGNVNATNPLLIDLSNGSAGLNNGNGGTLSIIAGFNFTPSTGGQVGPNSTIYTMNNSPSFNGGSVNLGNVNVITKSTVLNASAGNVLIIAHGGATNSGSVTLGNIDASADSTGGTIQIIAQGGARLGQITTSSVTGGDVTITSAAPQITGGSVIIGAGEVSGVGSFTAVANSAGGDIVLSGIDAGGASVALSTGSIYKITEPIATSIVAGALILNAGSGGAGSLQNPISTNAGVLTGSAFDGVSAFGDVFVKDSGAGVLLVGTNTANNFNLVMTSSGNIAVAAGSIPSAHGIRLDANGGIVSLPTNVVTAVADAQGNGGAITISGSDITWANSATQALNLTAVGTGAGDGGQIFVTTTSATARTIGSTAGRYKLDARSGATGIDGGTVSFLNNGTLAVDTAALTFSAQGANRNGGTLALQGSSITNVNAGNLLLSADGGGTGNGGSVSATWLSASPVTIGGGASDIKLTASSGATGGNAGSLSFNALNASLTVDAANGLIAGINGTNGNGGSISLGAKVLNNSNAGQALVLNANGKGIGNGGLVSININSNLAQTIGTGAGAFQLGANSGATGGNGGSASFSTLGSLAVDTNSINVNPLSANGAGGNIALSADSVSSSVAGSALILSANGVGTGGGGSVSVTTTGGAAQTIGTGAGQVELIAQGGTTSGAAGGSAVFSAAGDLTVNPAAIKVGPAAKVGNGGSITLIAGSGGTGNLLVTSSLSAAGKGTGTGGTINLQSSSAVNDFNIGSSTAVNGVHGSLSATGKTNAGSINVTNFAGGVTTVSSISSAKTITLTAGGNGNITMGAAVGGTKVTNAVVLTALGTGDITASTTKGVPTSKGSVTASSAGGDIVGLANAPLTVNAVGLTFSTQGTGIVNVSDKSKNAVIVGDSTSGGNFTLKTASATTLNDISVASGNISVTETTGLMQTAVGAVLTAVNGGINLQNSNASKGSILIGANSQILTNSGGGGDINIFLGSAPPAQFSGPNPGNVNITTSAPGQVFFGVNGITSNGAVNNINALGKNVTFSTGSKSAAGITLGGGLTITADPPVTAPLVTTYYAPVTTTTTTTTTTERSASTSVAAMPSTMQSALHVLPTQNLPIISNDLNSVSQNSITAFQNLGVVSQTVSEPAGSRRSQEETSALEPEWASAGELTTGEIPASIFFGSELQTRSDISTVVDLRNVGSANSDQMHMSVGSVLFAPTKDTAIETPLGKVSIDAQSLVFIMSHGKGLSIFNLDDNHRGAVKVDLGTRVITLAPGKMISIDSTFSRDFADINPAQLVAYRNVVHVHRNQASKVYAAEFSVPTLVSAVSPLKKLCAATRKEEKRVVSHLLKTTAIMMQIGGNGEDFHRIPRPEMTAFNR